MPYPLPLKARPLCVAIFALFCALALSACGLQPSIVDGPTPVPTPVGASVPDVDNGQQQHSKSTPQPGVVEPTLVPGQFTYANGVPFPVPSSEANPILTANMDMAWGANLDIHSVPAMIDADNVFQLRGVNEDGRFIVGEVVANSPYQDLHLALIDLQSTAITHLPESTIHTRMPYAHSTVAVDGDWVLWLDMQVQDGQLGSRKIKAYNHATGNLIEIAVGTEAIDLIPSFFLASPAINSNSVDRSIVVWAEPSREASEQGKIATVVKSYNLETGETTEVGKHGVKPAISWPYVAWLEPDTASEVEAEYLSQTVVRNLQTGEVVRIDGFWSIRELAVYEDVVARATGTTSFLENLAHTRRQMIQPLGGSFQVQKITMNDRLVAWAAYETPAVWDRQLERIIRLSGVTGLVYSYDACLVNGHTLAWQSGPSTVDLYQPNATLPPEDVRIYVLDTRQLSR